MWVFIICSILKTWNDYRSEYLSLASWQEWWNEMVETVRTARLRDVDNDESPAVEVLNYRSPEGYFASMLIYRALWLVCLSWVVSQTSNSLHKNVSRHTLLINVVGNEVETEGKYRVWPNIREELEQCHVICHWWLSTMQQVDSVDSVTVLTKQTICCGYCPVSSSFWTNFILEVVQYVYTWQWHHSLMCMSYWHCVIVMTFQPFFNISANVCKMLT